jgi:hypothetical protein
MKTLNIRTLTGYCDKDEIMLHACFQLLVDFVQKEWHSGKSKYFGKYFNIQQEVIEMKKEGLPNKIIKSHTDCLNRQNRETKEIWDLYFWWTKVRPKRKHKEMLKIDNKGNFLCDIEDEEMLTRLIKVRGCLWT